MKLKNPTAVVGLYSRFDMTQTLVAGEVTIGQPTHHIDLTGADIAYSLQMIATAANNAISIALATGLVTATSGAPTLVDANDKDLEGNAFPAMTSIKAVLFQMQAATSAAGSVLSANAGTIRHQAVIDQGYSLWQRSLAITTDVVTASAAAAGDIVTITIFGQSASAS